MFVDCSKDVSAVTEGSRIEQTSENHSNMSDVATVQRRNKRLSEVIEEVSSTDSSNRSLGERTDEQEVIASKRRKTEHSELRENGRL